MFDGNLIGSDAGMFRMFRLGPTWEEALCMFDRNFVEAMLACFTSNCVQAMFGHVLLARRKRCWHVSLWPNVGKGYKCMFDRNFVEAMPACFVETASKPCLPMCHMHTMFS